MSRKPSGRPGLWAAACLVSAMLAGCSASTSDVGVYLAGDIQNAYGYCPSIEVDVVGLTDAEKMRFLAYDVDKYFTPPAQFRKSLGAVTLKFSEDSMRAQKIPDNAEAWKRWEDKGAKYIGVISNLPIITEPGEGVTDPRKLIIDMHDGFMVDSSAHYVEVGGSGIIELKKEPETETEPEEAK